jgi:hypothetical protein
MLFEGMRTSHKIAGEPVHVFLAIAIHRKVPKPKIVCFIGSRKSLKAERDRIIEEIQAKSIALKTNTIIAITHANSGPTNRANRPKG